MNSITGLTNKKITILRLRGNNQTIVYNLLFNTIFRVCHLLNL